jgi:hypothetical protein
VWQGEIPGDTASNTELTLANDCPSKTGYGGLLPADAVIENLLQLLAAAFGLVSRVSPVQTAKRNCTRDEGRSFGFGDQVADPKPP